MSDTISIIMPVKNGIPYLIECLDSITNQSYNQWELLVVNDHSTDETAQVLDKYSQLDSRIKVINNIGKGIIDALNIGYSLSIGSFITRMDADDIMPIDKLETLINLLENNSLPSVATGHVKYFSADGVKDGYRSYEKWLNQLCIDNNHYRSIYKECVIASPAWLMRRTHFEMIGGFKSDTYPEDYDLCFRMYENNIRIESTNTIVHHWRDHSNRTSRNDDNYADNRFLSLKLAYFKKIEVPLYDHFILIGAGKKGKTVAKFLIENSIQFSWVTNNPKKIGIDIYGVILQSYDHTNLDNINTAIIISVANKDEQIGIKQKLSKDRNQGVYFFC